MAPRSALKMLICTALMTTDVLPSAGRNLFVAARDHGKGHHHKPSESTNSVSITETLTALPVPDSVSTVLTSSTIGTASSSETPTSSTTADSTATTISTSPASTDPTTSTILSTATIISTPQINTKIQSQGPQTCYLLPGGLNVAAQPLPGCGLILTQLTSCYADSAPWTTPYDTAQSAAFRACVCQSNSTHPFTTDSPVYLLWAGCAHCIFVARTFDTTPLTQQLMRVQSFCRAEEPDAFLFLQQLTHFFAELDSGFVITAPPLPDVTPMVQQLSAMYTTTPPLANLAYGASAPEGGSLAGVRPSLTTFTSEGVTGTRLVTWVPVGEGGTSTFDATRASRQAASRASSALVASLAAGTQETGQGAGSTMCYGRGPCNGAGSRRVPLGLLGGGLVWCIGLGMYGV